MKSLPSSAKQSRMLNKQNKKYSDISTSSSSGTLMLMTSQKKTKQIHMLIHSYEFQEFTFFFCFVIVLGTLYFQITFY